MITWAGVWWDDAINVANRRALLTGRRHRIKRGSAWGRPAWLVEQVGA